MTDDTVAIAAAPGYVIVKPLETREIQASGAGGRFDISDQASEKDQAGIILKVGDPLTTDYGATIEPIGKVGQTVVHKPYYTHPYKYEGMDLRFIRFQDIVGVYE